MSQDVPDFGTMVAELKKGAAPRFSPYAQYCAVADSLYIYLRNAPVFRRRINDTVTVLECAQDGELAGCVVKGVTRLLTQWGPRIGFTLAKNGKVRGNIVIWACVRQEPAIIEKLGFDRVQKLIQASSEQEIAVAAA